MPNDVCAVRFVMCAVFRLGGLMHFLVTALGTPKCMRRAQHTELWCVNGCTCMCMCMCVCVYVPLLAFVFVVVVYA
jgi:hypothetical protein